MVKIIGNNIEFNGKYNNNCIVYADNIEESSIQLIQGIVDNKISENKKIRIMPDTHTGVGIVIGFTMELGEIVNPNHVGVDIGCGMLTSVIENTNKEDLDLVDIDKKIKSIIPLQTNVHHKELFSLDYEILDNKINKFVEKYNNKYNTTYSFNKNSKEYIKDMCDKIGFSYERLKQSIGTLGSGNHFIEFGEDINKQLYVTIHTGSRQLGQKICNYHNKQSKDNCLTDDLFFNYCIDMVIAQYYATINRKSIMELINSIIKKDISKTIECHHNYIDFDDFIIRKGAIRSYVGEEFIIPMNMRDGILLCEGKSNVEWNCSAPHGAGRIMSRKQAKDNIKLEDFELTMKGIVSSSVNINTLDEAPMVYKSMNYIMKKIQDTAIIKNTIKPIMNIKG